MSTRSKRRLSLWFMICLLNLLVVCETNVCLNSHSCVTLFMWDSLIYVWLKLWWIYVRPYLCETWLIAMHVWNFLEHIIVVNQNCSLCEYQNFWPPTRTSDFRIGVLALCGNQKFWPSFRTSDVRLEVLTLRENQNFWPPVRTSDFPRPYCYV
jgi:hypothetical protein